VSISIWSLKLKEKIAAFQKLQKGR
jgi:hypothetical protein